MKKRGFCQRMVNFDADTFHTDKFFLCRRGDFGIFRNRTNRGRKHKFAHHGGFRIAVQFDFFMAKKRLAKDSPAEKIEILFAFDNIVQRFDKLAGFCRQALCSHRVKLGFRQILQAAFLQKPGKFVKVKAVFKSDKSS